MTPLSISNLAWSAVLAFPRNAHPKQYFLPMPAIASTREAVIEWAESVNAREIRAWRGPDKMWRAVAKLSG